jgi:predicted deacylase
MELCLPLHVINGTYPGPRLCLVSTSHGNEIYTIALLKTILESIQIPNLCGEVVAIPVANPLALDSGTRNTPIDMLDMNRLFPGERASTVSARTAAILAEIVEQVDCIIDYHCGSTELVTNHMLVESFSGTYGEKITHLSLAYGLPILHLSAGYRGSLTRYAAEKGIPAIVAEVGGGTILTEPFIRSAGQGVRNIMKVMGMLEGEPNLPEQQLIVSDMTILRTPQGGLFYPEIGADQLGQIVKKGTCLARIVNPLSLHEVRKLKAPYAETLLILMRTAISRVQPGDFAYFVGNMATAERASSHLRSRPVFTFD